MTTRRKPVQPVGLAAAGAALWQAIAGPYDLRADELRILADACRTADVVAELDEARVGQPLTTRGSMGQEVIHPFVMELRQQRAQLAALLGRLKLPDDPAAGQRPSATSTAARKAAVARWAKRA